ncbi:MAG: hypothetical protein PHD43_18845 [Methylococcales bacterium]|nr:hypothetical protein [Methylococcales bacterium]
MQNADRNVIDLAIRELPAKFREVLALRELEDFSYVAAIKNSLVIIYSDKSNSLL